MISVFCIWLLEIVNRKPAPKPSFSELLYTHPQGTGWLQPSARNTAQLRRSLPSRGIWDNLRGFPTRVTNMI